MTLCTAGLASAALLRPLTPLPVLNKWRNGSSRMRRNKEQAQEAKFVQVTSEVCGSSQKHVAVCHRNLAAEASVSTAKKTHPSFS